MFPRQNINVVPIKRIVLLAILAILLLLEGTTLLFPDQAKGFFPGIKQTQQKPLNIVPILILSPSQATIGQSVNLYLVHFPPSTSVVITHDVGKIVQTNNGSSVIKIGLDGTANVMVNIDKTWEPGSHILGVEDTTTLYAKIISIQVSTG